MFKKKKSSKPLSVVSMLVEPSTGQLTISTSDGGLLSFVMDFSHTPITLRREVTLLRDLNALWFLYFFIVCIQMFFTLTENPCKISLATPIFVSGLYLDSIDIPQSLQNVPDSLHNMVRVVQPDPYVAQQYPLDMGNYETRSQLVTELSNLTSSLEGIGIRFELFEESYNVRVMSTNPDHLNLYLDSNVAKLLSLPREILDFTSYLSDIPVNFSATTTVYIAIETNLGSCNKIIHDYKGQQYAFIHAFTAAFGEVLSLKHLDIPPSMHTLYQSPNPKKLSWLKFAIYYDDDVLYPMHFPVVINISHD